MSNPIVLFSTAYFPLIGGAEVAVREIMDRLPEGEFHVVTARIRPGLVSRERIGNAEVHRVGIGHSLDKYWLIVAGPFVAWWIQRRVSRPVVWALMASYNGAAALLYTWLRPKTKLLLTLQEGDPLEHIDARVGRFRPFFRKLFQRADAIQAISRFLADWAKRMGARVEPEVIPNGVDVVRFTKPLSVEERRAVRDELGFRPDDIVLVTTGRLIKKNALDDVIRALPLLPASVKFLSVGIGEDGQMLHDLAVELAVGDRVRFLGAKSHDELPRYLRAADMFIRPSLSEGLGNSFLEAMAAELPIIGTPVGGIPDFLMDGETGVMCQPRDPTSIAAAVQRLLTDAALVQRLRVSGPQLIQRSYTWESIAERMARIFASFSL